MSRFLVRENSVRLDIFLAAASGLSRRGVRKLISEGLVWRQGRALRQQSKALQEGDVIDLLLAEAEIPNKPWRPLPLSIVFEDRDLIAVNKPGGLLSQPIRDGENSEDAMDRRLLSALSLREGRRAFLRMVHRLDRPTSGLMIFARSPQALPMLDKAWRGGRVRRLYLAVLSGRPSWIREDIDRPIARDPGGSWRFRCDSGGRPAETRFRVLFQAKNSALTMAELKSGRTHQVRVHAAELGYPVLGDRLYGAPDDAAGVLLHAWGISLPHPRTGEPLYLNAPVPERFQAFLPPDFNSDPWRTESSDA